MMNADLLQFTRVEAGNVWLLLAQGRNDELLRGKENELIDYAIKKGCTLITLWIDGRQQQTIEVPKQTLGKNECTV